MTIEEAIAAGIITEEEVDAAVGDPPAQAQAPAGYGPYYRPNCYQVTPKHRASPPVLGCLHEVSQPATVCLPPGTRPANAWGFPI